MSYQVLARKWRPKTFTEVVGQRHILTALSNGLKENRLHHAYLFSGTRGVGKTSIARLFAKGLNCVHGVTAEPCGECEHCKAIEEGRFIDLIEIDAASRTKVEDTRELLDNVQYKPVQGRYKVYLIDEVHMLSRHSFNALLKTLEEPPEYVKFLLATTDPQKLPITILSRCMQFHLKALEQTQIAQHLEFILKQEHIPFDFLALEKLAKAAQGSIRDSLSLTDQAIAMSNGNISLSVVNDMLGLLDDNQAIEVIYALQQGDGESMMGIVQRVAEKGVDWDEFLRDIGEQLHHIAMKQLRPKTQLDESSQLDFLATHISPDDLQFFYQVILSGRQELAFAPTQRIGAEMTLLRALAFSPKQVNAEASVGSAASSSAATTPSHSTAYVDMPVVSQNIKAQYAPNVLEKSATKPSSTPAVPVSPTPSVSPESATVSSSTAETQTDATHSVALEALAELDKLDSVSLSQLNQEKKNLDVAPSQPSSVVAPHSKTTEKLTALPVVEAKSLDQRLTTQKTPVQLQPITEEESGMSAMHDLETENALEAEEGEMSDSENLAETYRWAWRNPELANLQSGPTPSELKQSLEKDITPELREKVISLARQEDEWTNIVESLEINNLTKELALNCALLEKQQGQILLGIRPEKAHLEKQTFVKNLAQQLSQFYHEKIEVVISVNSEIDSTPTDFYRQTYKRLRDKAKLDLQQDSKLQLFLTEFHAELDLHSVKPV
ncbi:DNA polymerase III subunit gamma/tau [Pasteurella sp. PK-2025]|uniref:DNA polymerase III subunit gamma/tau n=1 Tax=Pasteurella sp. PK-2025 TaxID=3413133 RepID=UPI003C7327D0